MARTVRFSQVLWVLTSAWLAACGRLGFDSNDDGLGNRPPDAGQTVDAAPDAPPDVFVPVGPKAKLAFTPNLATECGANNGPTDILKITNDGDQPLELGDVNLVEIKRFQLLTAYSATTIQPGESIELEYRAPDAEIGLDIGNTTLNGELRFPSNIVEQGVAKDVVVALTAKVHGANVVISNKQLAFNSTFPTCPGDINVMVTNTGNQPVTLDPPTSMFSGFDLQTDFSATKILQPSQKQAVKIHAATNNCSGEAQLVFSTSSSGVCTDTDGMTVKASLQIAGGSSCSC